MKNLIKYLSLALLIGLPTYSFSNEVEFKCNKLISGEMTKRLWANYSVKEIDLLIKIDPVIEGAKMTGSLVINKDRGPSNDEIFEVNNNFEGTEIFSVFWGTFSISTFDRTTDCREDWMPCRIWSKLKIDLNTGISSYTKSYSYDYIYGDIYKVMDLKFICERN